MPFSQRSLVSKLRLLKEYGRENTYSIMNKRQQWRFRIAYLRCLFRPGWAITNWKVCGIRSTEMIAQASPNVNCSRKPFGYCTGIGWSAQDSMHCALDAMPITTRNGVDSKSISTYDRLFWRCPHAKHTETKRPFFRPCPHKECVLAHRRAPGCARGRLQTRKERFHRI